MDFSEYLHSIWNVFRKNDMVLWVLSLNSYIIHCFTANPDVVALIGSRDSFAQENVNTERNVLTVIIFENLLENFLP